MTDVHSYGGNSGNLVTGTFQPDGRDIDPTSAGTVFESASRQNSGLPLGLFNGMDPNGDWVLHVTDHGAVGASAVKSWGMTIVVPEPTRAVLASAIQCCVAVLAKRFHMQSRR